MNFVKYFNLFGTPVTQLPCTKLDSAPTSSTEGAVGMLAMVTSGTELGKIYKCVSVDTTNKTYTWKVMESGDSTSANIPVKVFDSTNIDTLDETLAKSVDEYKQLFVQEIDAAKSDGDPYDTTFYTSYYIMNLPPLNTEQEHNTVSITYNQIKITDTNIWCRKIYKSYSYGNDDNASYNIDKDGWTQYIPNIDNCPKKDSNNILSSDAIWNAFEMIRIYNYPVSPTDNKYFNFTLNDDGESYNVNFKTYAIFDSDGLFVDIDFPDICVVPYEHEGKPVTSLTGLPIAGDGMTDIYPTICSSLYLPNTIETYATDTIYDDGFYMACNVYLSKNLKNFIGPTKALYYHFAESKECLTYINFNDETKGLINSEYFIFDYTDCISSKDYKLIEMYGTANINPRHYTFTITDGYITDISYDYTGSGMDVVFPYEYNGEIVKGIRCDYWHQEPGMQYYIPKTYTEISAPHVSTAETADFKIHCTMKQAYLIYNDSIHIYDNGEYCNSIRSIIFINGISFDDYNKYLPNNDNLYDIYSTSSNDSKCITFDNPTDICISNNNDNCNTVLTFNTDSYDGVVLYNTIKDKLYNVSLDGYITYNGIIYYPKNIVDWYQFAPEAFTIYCDWVTSDGTLLVPSTLTDSIFPDGTDIALHVVRDIKSSDILYNDALGPHLIYRDYGVNCNPLGSLITNNNDIANTNIIKEVAKQLDALNARDRFLSNLENHDAPVSYTPNSFAQGDETIAGQKGYMFTDKAWDSVNEALTLKLKGQAFSDYNRYSSSEPSKCFALDDVISISTGDDDTKNSVYPIYNYGKIINITSDADNSELYLTIDVSVDKLGEPITMTSEQKYAKVQKITSFNFTKSIEKDATSRYIRKVWVIAKPWIGDYSINLRSVVFNRQNKSRGDCSFSAGRRAEANADISVALNAAIVNALSGFGVNGAKVVDGQHAFGANQAYIDGKSSAGLNKSKIDRSEFAFAANEGIVENSSDDQDAYVGSHGSTAINKGTVTNDAAFAFAHGYNTVASGYYQRVGGQYNEPDSTKLEIVGIGYVDDETGETIRKNGYSLDKNGNAYFAGTIESSGIILTSPNGSKFKLTVSDDGTLSTIPVTE